MSYRAVFNMITAAVLAVLIVAPDAHPQGDASDDPTRPKGQSKPDDQSQKAITVKMDKIPGDLGEMLALAYERNPDIRLAEADLRHAVLEMQQIRLQVAQAVVEAYYEMEVLQNALEGVKEQYARIQRLQEAKSVDEGAVAGRFQELMEARTAHSRSQAQLRAIIGLDPAGGEMPEKLEDMVAKALECNGEIALAEAGLVRMEAMLNQVRLKVTQEVSSAFHQRRIMDNALALEQQRLQVIQMQADRGLASTEKVMEARQALLRIEAEAMQDEAFVRYLLGLGVTLSK